MFENEITRREFLAALAVAYGAACAPALPAFAAPLTGKKIRLRLRQDFVYDTLMNAFLGGFNKKSRDIRVVSSYHPPEKDWSEERAAAERVPEKLTGGEDYEIFITHSTNLARMADEGMVEPLDAYLGTGELAAGDFHTSRYGGILDSVTYRGRVWALPIAATPYALFCNLDIFERGGATPPVTTWQDTLAAARKMVIDTDGDGAPDLFGYSQCSFQFPLQIITAGLELVDLANKRVTFDSEAGVDALELYANLKACSPPHVDFERGDMGMKVSVTTNAFGRYDKIRHKIVPLPSGAARANSYGDSDGALVAGIRSGEPEVCGAAYRFLEWLLSEKVYFKLTRWFRHLPLRKSILAGERFAAHLEKYPQLVPFLGEMEYAAAKPCIPEYNFISIVLREVLIPVQVDPPEITTRAEMAGFLKRQAARCNERLAKAEW